MAKRRRAESEAHHGRVQRLARQLKREGWRVKAAGVRGYEQPHKIAGRVPDIVASKPGTTRIIEVETPGSLRAQKDQLKALTRHASRKGRTTFEVVVTRPRKKRG